ncbi:MAG: HK97 gp10 family phage protein [Clostridiales bacterium]|jgi:hypothetical protein|nr:HK97 gp10 family phage protein [Clostridiales bacterium]
MAFGAELYGRAAELRKLAKDAPGIIAKAHKAAAFAALEAAKGATPPSGDEKARGANTVDSGAAKSWEADFEQAGGLRRAIISNGKEYISYLNDGHRMDRHFVPGLTVNPFNGMLERLDSSEINGKLVGLVVGTKTLYVPGLHMREKAREAYEKTLLGRLDGAILKNGR